MLRLGGVIFGFPPPRVVSRAVSAQSGRSGYRARDRGIDPSARATLTPARGPRGGTLRALLVFARRFARAFRARVRFGRDIDLALLRAISAWVCFAVGFRFVWLFSGRRGCFHGIQLAKLPRVALTASLDVKRAPQTLIIAVAALFVCVFGCLFGFLFVFSCSTVPLLL